MTDLDTVARAATTELLDRTTPDVPTRYAELSRIRAKRTAAKFVAVAATVALAAGGWQLAGGTGTRVEPAPPTGKVTNGVLLGRPASSATSFLSWVVIDGGTLAVLPEQAATYRPAQFTTDGREVVYADESDDLVALDVESGARRTLTSCAKWDCYGSLSPDGTTAAWSTQQGISLVPLGSSTGRVLPTAAWHGLPTWAPDGTRLGYMTSDGIHVVDLASGNDELVHAFTDQATLPMPVRWSPDGSSLAFFDTETLPRRGYDETRFMATTLNLADGTTRTLLDAGHCVCLSSGPPPLTWSPDGTLIAVGTMKGSPRLGVVVLTPDGEEVEWFGYRTLEDLLWQPVTG